MKMQYGFTAACLAGSIGILGPGCSSASTSSTQPGGNGGAIVGGNTGMGGSTAIGGSSSTNNGTSVVGGATASGGAPTTSSSASSGGAAGATTGTTGNSLGSGGAAVGGSSAGTGGTASLGGASSTRTGGASSLGGSTTKGTTGGSAASGTGGAALGGSGTGGAVTGGATATGGSSFNYLLPPPDQCHDVDYQPWSSDPTTGCVSGNPASKCGGKCQTASVCEDTSSKPNADVEYMCPRDLLFSKEMEQAVVDDGFDGFHYAVVGHDPDRNGIDGTSHTCCQCYQLVFAYPSPNNDRQAQLNPDNPNPPASAIPIPPPLIVQSFNTAASPTTFDIYMPAGGMGANNGCYPVSGSPSAGSGKYMYTSYPPDGQPGQGGVKPASLYQECKTQLSWVTTASLSSQACIDRTTTACNKMASNIPGLTQLASTGCLKANTIDTFYHLNWSVYAMRVECPEHLTRVTGCKLATQTGVKPPKKDVTTAAQAAKDPDFWSHTSSSSNLYETTTMEDCCRPTCASYSQISNFGLITDPQYRSFYNCDVNGVPWTQ